MPSDRRLERINEAINRVIGEAILELGNLPPAIFISVSGVKVAPSLEWATVKISVFPDEGSAMALDFLKRNRVIIQSKINDALHARRTPKINFVLDRTIADAEALRHEAEL